MSALAQRIEDHPLSRAANDDCFNGGLRTRTKYQYDANGNMTNRDGDAITWYAHNLPKKIHYGSDSAEFWYGPDRGRYKQVAISGGSTATTRYVGDHFEVETRGGLTISRHWILADGERVALYERRSDGTFLIRYPHRDHQGNIVTTVNQKWEYEPFGMRARTIGSGADDTERGYTGHEHLDSVALIHMNGRVQDPVLGRFVSADPLVQAPYHSQSLNRYSYAWNNPLSLVDPSGFQVQGGPYDEPPSDMPFVPGGGRLYLPSDAEYPLITWPWILEETPSTAPPSSLPQGGVPNAGAVASTGVLTYPIADRLPPIKWPDLAGLGRQAVSIGGKALGVAGGLLWPSNGLSSDKPGECYGTLTCAARPVAPSDALSVSDPNMYSKDRPPGAWPGDRGAKEWDRRNNTGRKGQDKFHDTKQHSPWPGGDEDWSVNPDTGTIYDPNGEPYDDLEP